MNAAQIEKICKTYPRLFAKDLMPWEFENGDGWNQIFESLCARIDSMLKKIPGATITIRPVKEKLVGLRFYYELRGVNEEHSQAVREVVAWAYAESKRTCERCGEPGALQSISGPIKTLCSTCRGAYDKEGEKIFQPLIKVDVDAYLAKVDEADRSVLVRAITLVQREFEHNEIIRGPISFLQRRLSIGYAPGLRIARHLVYLQTWKIFADRQYGRIAFKVCRF